MLDRTTIIRTGLAALAALLLAATAAQASYSTSYDISSLESYLNGQNGYAAASYELYTGDLSGVYNVTALAYEAGHTNSFYGSATGSALFSNSDTGNFGTFVTGLNLTTAYYQDLTDHEIYGLTGLNVKVYRLTAEWAVPELGIELSAGTLILGLNDSWSGDGDFDDLILAANPTPLPGAAWLLGTGLLGLLGVRKVLNRF